MGNAESQIRGENVMTISGYVHPVWEFSETNCYFFSISLKILRLWKTPAGVCVCDYTFSATRVLLYSLTGELNMCLSVRHMTMTLIKIIPELGYLKNWQMPQCECTINENVPGVFYYFRCLLYVHMRVCDSRSIVMCLWWECMRHVLHGSSLTKRCAVHPNPLSLCLQVTQSHPVDLWKMSLYYS